MVECVIKNYVCYVFGKYLYNVIVYTTDLVMEHSTLKTQIMYFNCILNILVQ